MRVVLCTLNSSYTHSSLALRYLRAAIREQWPDNHLLEFQIKDDLRRVVAEVGRLRPDVVALSCYIWNVTATLALATDLKAIMPRVRIVIGGPEVGPRAEELLTAYPAIDFVIAGEGEQAFVELLQALQADLSPLSIPGVYYRNSEGQIGSTPAQRLDPEKIPRPYTVQELDELQHKLVYYETSRGCPYRCSYCLSGGDRVRFLPMERVFADLKLLLETNVPLIKFVDRTFNCDPQRALSIMQFLLANRRDSRFHFEICADILTEELLEWLLTVPAGVFQFEIGMQSLNPATLEAIGRRMQWEKLSSNVRRLRAADNIHLHLDLIAGLPWQDWEAIGFSFDQVIALEPHMLQLGFLKVLPGTQIARQVQQFGLKVSCQPPYEVLASNWLAFEQLNRLHLVEELLEYYYNSGLLRYSLPYMWSRGGASPFQWFLQFAEHWEALGLHLMSHGREALFAYLEKHVELDQVLQELLMIDKARMLPSFPAQFKLPESDRAAWEAYLTESLPQLAPRTYKQAFRTIFPLKLRKETLSYLGQSPACNTAVIDRESQKIIDFIKL